MVSVDSAAIQFDNGLGWIQQKAVGHSGCVNKSASTINLYVFVLVLFVRELCLFWIRPNESSSMRLLFRARAMKISIKTTTSGGLSVDSLLWRIGWSLKYSSNRKTSGNCFFDVCHQFVSIVDRKHLTKWVLSANVKCHYWSTSECIKRWNISLASRRTTNPTRSNTQVASKWNLLRSQIEHSHPSRNDRMWRRERDLKNV